MFRMAKFYVIVCKNRFVIIRKDDISKTIIDFQSYIPNVPFYHHLFDNDKKEYINDIMKQIKRLKIKNAEIILPDDCLDLEVDKRILIEFFLQCGVKKVQVNFQYFYLNLYNKNYISVSRTTRTVVIQYTSYNKVISKKYYDKDFMDMEKIAIDIKNLHPDCNMPVYINNINNDMEGFSDIGNLVSMQDIISNILNYHE
jgi:hypothetical protein